MSHPSATSAAFVALIAWASLSGCEKGAGGEKEAGREKETGREKEGGGPPMTIEVTSSAFKAGAAIPKKYTDDGDDVSPPLSWNNLPSGTKELALICDDPDAPSKEPWVHWLIYKVPAEVSELPEAVPADEKLDSPRGALQGANSWTSGRTVGYLGPAPPSGTHHYHFHLYALDAPLKLEAKASKAALLKAMKGHILAEGELVGTYKR